MGDIGLTVACVSKCFIGIKPVNLRMQTSLKTIVLLSVLSLPGAGAYAQAKKYTIAPGLIAEVAHIQGSIAVTVKIPGVEQIDVDISQPADGIYQIKTADYNFDGFKDFAFVGTNGTTGMHVYDIFLYHPADRTFESLEVSDGACEVFGNVRTNPAEKTLRSSCKSGKKSSLDVYKWADAFTLQLVKSTDNSADAQADAAEEKATNKEEQADKRKEKRELIKEKREEKDEDD